LFLKSRPPLILASTSLYRRTLLERLRIPFTSQSPGIDEAARPGELPDALVARLARAKAGAVAALHHEAWVIGSDQTAVLSDAGGALRMLGKPGDVPQCIGQLQQASGRTLTFLTAVAVVREGAGGHEFIDTTRVRFRTLDRATIERYVEAESPLDCAGGFKSEGLGISLCESIESDDPSALVGLPLIRLAAILREVGLQVP
jgi:7-methyl-GTP pyrophosphatase